MIYKKKLKKTGIKIPRNLTFLSLPKQKAKGKQKKKGIAKISDREIVDNY